MNRKHIGDGVLKQREKGGKRGKEEERIGERETCKGEYERRTVENPFTPNPRPLSETRLCRGYFAAFARELRLNENLLYIPCTSFPLPFFSPVHILINGSFLRECNARETKSQRDWSRFIALSLPLALSLSLSPLSLPHSLSLSLILLFFSSRMHVHCVRSNRGMCEFPCRSCSPCQSPLHFSCPMLR